MGHEMGHWMRVSEPRSSCHRARRLPDVSISETQEEENKWPTGSQGCTPRNVKCTYQCTNMPWEMDAGSDHQRLLKKKKKAALAWKIRASFSPRLPPSKSNQLVKHNEFQRSGSPPMPQAERLFLAEAAFGGICPSI